jgi:hypothetical protein
LRFEASPGNSFLRPYLENIPTQKRADGVAQVVEHLPGKNETPVQEKISILQMKTLRLTEAK